MGRRNEVETCSTVFLRFAAEIGRKEKVRRVQLSLEVCFTEFKQSECCDLVLVLVYSYLKL